MKCWGAVLCHGELLQPWCPGHSGTLPAQLRGQPNRWHPLSDSALRSFQMQTPHSTLLLSQEFGTDHSPCPLEEKLQRDGLKVN